MICALLLVLFVLGWGIPLALGLWVRQEIERRLAIKVEGILWPGFFQPSFELKTAHFTWTDRLKLISGDLKVDYDLISLLNQRRIRVKISGRDLQTSLLGEWAENQGLSDLKFNDFFADFEVGKQGLEEVNVLKAHSRLLNLDFTPRQGGAGAVDSTPASEPVNR